MRAGDGDWGRQAVDTRVFVIYSQHFHIPFDCPESSRVDVIRGPLMLLSACGRCPHLCDCQAVSPSQCGQYSRYSGK